MSINQEIYKALKAKGYDGNIQDMLKKHWVFTAGAGKFERDFWLTFNPGSQGSLDDLKRKALTGLGYTGSVQDQYYKFAKDGFGVVIPTNPTPTKTFNFLTSSLDPLFTFTRNTVGTYFDMNGVMQTATANVPRYDFDPAAATLRGILIEEARTNLCTNSNGFITGNYTLNDVTATRNQVDVFGQANMASIIAENTNSNTHSFLNINNFSYVSGTTYTQSVYAKAAGTNRFQLLWPAAAFGAVTSVNFGLTGAGSILQINGSATARINYMGNGWYRCEMTSVATGSASGSQFVAACINSNTAARSPTYTGVVTNTFILSAGQTEAGEFASSYIPTVGSAVTRNRDELNITSTNFSGFYNQTAGAWIAEFITGPQQNLANRIFDSSDGTAANSIFMFRSNTSDEIDSSINTGGVNRYSSNQVGQATYKPQVGGVSYTDNASKTALNNILDVASPSAGTMPPVTRIDIGDRFDGARTFNGWIRKLDYYNVKLTDTQLKDRTMVRPVPGALLGLTPQTTQIVATTGQVISRLNISTTSASCIVIPPGVHDVTIEFCDIGPAGSNLSDDSAKGIDIQAGAYNITIRGCVFHDVSSAVYADGANHPIDVLYSYAYNIRGPLPRGQMVQLNGCTGGVRSSKIMYNMSDAMAGFRYGVDHGAGMAASGGVEDHFNMYGSPGLSALDPVEIAYNHARGGHATSNSGSMMILGDGTTQSGYQYAHHNVAVNVKNVGIGIAGGINQKIESNRFYMNNATIYTNIAMYVINYATPITCNLIEFINNKSWCYNGTSQNNFYWQNGGPNDCTNVTQTGQSYGDVTMNIGMFGLDI